MSEVKFGRLPCADACPFGHMCGTGWKRDEKICVTNIDNAVPRIDNVKASGNNLEARDGPVLIAQVRSGVVYRPD